MIFFVLKYDIFYTTNKNKIIINKDVWIPRIIKNITNNNKFDKHYRLLKNVHPFTHFLLIKLHIDVWRIQNSPAFTILNIFFTAPRGVGVNVPFRPPTANLNYMPRGVQPNIPVPQTMPHIYHHNIEQAAGAAVSMPGRSSPSVIPTGGSSPLATKNATPPPPPYARPPLLRFPPPGMANAPTLGPRSVALGHMQSPRGRLSPHQTAIPPNYHFATFPPNVSEDGIPAPPSSYANAYEQFAAEAQGEKMYEEDGEGEFGGLVSYFSSQREDDLDT